MWQSVFLRVFSKGRYVILALGTFFLSLSLVLLLPHFILLGKVFASEGVALSTKLGVLISLYGSIITNFTPLSATYTLTLLVLFAVNVTLLVFYTRRAQKQSLANKPAQATGLAGMVSGVLGIGCAACGSVILTGLATSVGAAGLLVALPLRGGEFAILGIILLVVSIYYLTKKIYNPLVCPTKY